MGYNIDKVIRDAYAALDLSSKDICRIGICLLSSISFQMSRIG